jgi:hypothetical protein
LSAYTNKKQDRGRKIHQPNLEKYFYQSTLRAIEEIKGSRTREVLSTELRICGTLQGNTWTNTLGVRRWPFHLPRSRCTTGDSLFETVIYLHRSAAINCR